MASADVTVPRAAERSSLVAFLEREGLVVAVVSGFAASVAFRLPWRVAQDAWLALVTGRQVAHNGIPGTDTLTYWTVGRHWIDQQWLGQAFSYALYSVGGVKLYALAHVALVVLALTVVTTAARRRRASPRAVTWVALVAVYLLALTAGHVRAQSFAYLLFALVLLLLLDDERRPSRRVFLVLPLLVLWANVHGSVVLGAVLVAVYGVVAVRRAGPARTIRGKVAALVAGSGLALVATPWFLGTLDYYRSTLFNSAFKDIVSEWRAPALSVEFLPLFLLAGAGVWLLGRCRCSFSSFDRLALLLLIGLSFVAQRNICWLALGAIPLLAPALDEVLPQAAPPIHSRLNVALSLTAGAIAVAVVLGSAFRAESWYLSPWPAGAADAVARAAKADPSARIYSNERYADWLLMTEPQLAGRVAYDVRFELLSAAQLTAIVRWRDQSGPGWERAADGARIVVLALPDGAGIATALRRQGARVLYAKRDVSVLLRPAREARGPTT